MAGVTADGFVRKTVEVILDEVEVDQREDIDPALDQSSSSFVGQNNGIISSQLGEAWEVLETAYNAFNRSAAEGVALDNVGELTGTTRNNAVATIVTNVNVNIDDLFSALPGEMVASITGRPDLRFTNQVAVSNSTGGTIDFLTTFVAEATGPTVVNDQTLIVIAEPLTGWNSVTNRQDPNPDDSKTAIGAIVQGDTDLRVSQAEELRAQGGASEPAIDAALEAVTGVISVKVFFNDTDFIDSNGLPPHSIEALIFDGETPVPDIDPILAQTLFDVKAAGIQTVGNQGPFNALTSEGENFPVFFSRPVQRNIWIEVDIIVNPQIAPADVEAQVEAAVVAEGTARAEPGRDVIALDLACAAKEVAGVIDVPELRLGFAASPTGTANLAIQPRELAVFSTARTTATDVTP